MKVSLVSTFRRRKGKLGMDLSEAESVDGASAVAPDNAAPIPARPPRPDRLMPPLRFMRALQANFVSVWPEDAYARPVTHVRIGRRHLFTANDPALVKHVLLDNAANYHKSPILRRLLEPALGQGLVTSDGAVWKRHRQLVAPIFAQRRVAALVPAMAEEALDNTERWRAQSGQPFALTEALSRITLDIITRTMFGAESRAETTTIAADADTYQKMLRPSLLDFLGVPDWVPRPGARGARKLGDKLTETIHRVVAQRRALGGARDDLLALLLEAVDRQELSAQEIRDEIATIFIAGHETSAMALGWALYLLDLHPDIEQRVAEEIRAVLDGRLPTAEDVARLTLTRMVVEEALRLYPTAHTMTRIALGPDRLGDVPVPKGAVVMISTWLTHRNPTLWTEPDRFDPERFDPERAGPPRSRYSYFPFGAGPRVCVGGSFALQEIMVVLATMLQRWRVRMAPGHPIEPVALITLRPRFGLRAIAEPRVL
jgi:cytochrome P450